MSTYSGLKIAADGSVTIVYAVSADLPLSDVATGAQAYVTETNRLYFWNGTGWYNIALINTAPTITTGGDATYVLAKDGSATVVTLEANDPEGIPIVWSYAVTTGSLGSTATVSQADNVFTITPSIVEADAGDFTLTFTASDGVNLSTSASEFSLVFLVPGRAIFYNDAAQADQVQTGSGDNPEWYFGKATRHIWTVPSGVTSVHAICVGAGGGSTNAGGGGGGGLTWANDIPVTPGAQYEVLVGSPGGTHYGNPNYIGGSSELSLVGGANVLFAGGGGTGHGAVFPTNAGGLGGTVSNAAGLTAGGGSGGNGGGANEGMHGGGGGAGGYTGTGGAAGDNLSNPNGTAGTGGGGGGGAAGNSSGSGGGVNIFGQGDNGTAGTHPGSGWGLSGGGGSGGADGVFQPAQGFGGGNYGGGGGYTDRPGGNGIVTIIWGLNRAYPNTNVDLAGDN